MGTDVSNGFVTGRDFFEVRRARPHTPRRSQLMGCILFFLKKKEVGIYQRKIDHAAGTIVGSISLSLGFARPAFTFLSKCFFMSSI
jgi:hypothetical protein